MISEVSGANTPKEKFSDCIKPPPSGDYITPPPSDDCITPPPSVELTTDYFEPKNIKLRKHQQMYWINRKTTALLIKCNI